MEPNFGWDYPPGVTGNEPEIAGYPPCAYCRHDSEEHLDEEDNELTHCRVDGCNCGVYAEYAEIDPDYERERNSL